MINLTASGHQLLILLDNAPTGSPPLECHCMVNYRETTEKTYEFKNNAVYSDSNNSQILVQGSSVGNNIRTVDEISIYNPDTGSCVVTISFYDGTNEYILVQQTLAQFETLIYNDKNGWTII